MPPAEKSRIEDLKRSLYERGAPEVRTRRRFRFSDRDSGLKTDWEHPKEPEGPASLNEVYEKHSMSFFAKLLIGSAVFCALALAGGAYIFLNGANLISANNIDITMSGPVSVSGGSTVPVSVTVVNKNNVTLRAATLEVDFPSGSADPSDPTKTMKPYQVVLGDLPPGGSITEQTGAVMFGEQDLEREITATVSYGIQGSSSVFTKIQTYAVLISSSPAVLSVSSFKEVASGQPFGMTVDLKSNSQDVLHNVLMKAAYPFGYSFKSSSIAPADAAGDSWFMGDLPPGADRQIVITGSLTGENSDTRAFRFSAGAQSRSDPAAISSVYAQAEQDVAVAKPFISVGMAIESDRSSSDYVGRFGQQVSVRVDWSNNLPETVSNAVITVHLSGSAYDPSGVSPGSGYFRSSTNDIVWDQRSDPALASVPAGGSGYEIFSVTPVDAGAVSGVQTVDPEVTLSASVSADRTQESGVSGQTAAIARNIKIASDATLSGRVVRTEGSFADSGPIPPKVDQKTAYTVVWTVDNTSNVLSNAQVTAVLPPYVSWTGQIDPTGADVSYDANSGTVTWNVGAVDTYTLGSSQRKSVSFQVVLQPGVDQIGQAPILVRQATLSAADSWTGGAVTGSQDPLTTSFSTDPAFKQGDDIVQAAGQ